MGIDSKQWTKVDRADLMSIKLFVYEFIEILIEKLSNITVHSFIAWAQFDYLKNLKRALGPNEVIMLCNFTEQYSFVIQDEVLGYHWNKINVPFILLSYIIVLRILLLPHLFASCLMFLTMMLVLSTKLWRQQLDISRQS